MSRTSQVASATITRPADTTAYASNDLIANSTTAGSVTLSQFKIKEGGIWLRRVRIHSNNANVTNASFRLWLTTDSAITFASGDNGGVSISSSTLPIGDVLCHVDVTVDGLLTGAGAVGGTNFDPGIHAIYPSGPANGIGTVYGFLEARAAYTPASGEIFTITLRGDPI